MASITNIKTDITTLNDYQLQELFNYIGEMLSFGSIKSTLNEEFKESRFSIFSAKFSISHPLRLL